MCSDWYKFPFVWVWVGLQKHLPPARKETIPPRDVCSWTSVCISRTFFSSHKSLWEHRFDQLGSAQSSVLETPVLRRKTQAALLWGFIHPSQNACEYASRLESRAVVFLCVCPERLLINIGSHSPRLTWKTVCTYGHDALSFWDLKVKAYRKALHRFSGAWKARVTSKLCLLWCREAEGQ